MAINIKKAWDALFESKNATTQQSYQDLALWQDLGLSSDSNYPYWTYPLMAKFAFERNVVAYKAIMSLSKAVGGLKWCLYDANGKEITDVNHPLLKLIKAPNPAQGCSTFFQHAQASKLLDGNIFIEMVAAGLNNPTPSLKTPPRELWIKRPDWVQVIPGEMRLPAEYIYTPGGADAGTTVQRFPVNGVTGASSIIHIQSYSPLFEDTMLRGLSPMRSAIMQVLTHNEGQNWNMNLLKNSARPSGAFSYAAGKDGIGSLTEEQIIYLKKQIADIYGSSKNAGKPIVLDNMTWQEMSLNPKDADWSALKDSAARDICNSVGYPPLLLGIPGDNTFSNYQEARLSFYEDTVLPEAKVLRDELNRRLVPLFGTNLSLQIDEDEISALATKRAEKLAAISAAPFLTVNEKREAMGYDETEDGDVVLVPTMTTTLELIANPPPPPPPPVIVNPGDAQGNDDDGDEEE